MDLITNVKVSGINSLTDARFFSGAGVQYAGFCFDKNNARYIPTEQVFQIKDWLAFPSLVAEFGNNSTVDEINNVVTKIGFDYVELPDGFPIGAYSQLESTIIQRVAVEHLGDITELGDLLATFPEQVDFFILEFRASGFEWNVIELDKSNVDALKALCVKYDVILDVNITLDNAERIVEMIEPLGIEIQSGDEIKIGVRSFEEIADLMELLEAGI